MHALKCNLNALNNSKQVLRYSCVCYFTMVGTFVLTPMISLYLLDGSCAFPPVLFKSSNVQKKGYCRTFNSYSVCNMLLQVILWLTRTQPLISLYSIELSHWETIMLRVGSDCLQSVKGTEQAATRAIFRL